MSTASFLPAASRARRWPKLRRWAAWLAATASDPKAGLWLVIGFAAAHAVLWTLILVNLKAAQDVHMDVAEAFAWGQKFQFGYGKHPPLSGWVAGLWFRFFPVANWATYALAMATLGCGLVISWLIALRVVDRRRAFFVVVMLALYPIFNFKGFKYNPDLLQLVTLSDAASPLHGSSIEGLLCDRHDRLWIAEGGGLSQMQVGSPDASPTSVLRETFQTVANAPLRKASAQATTRSRNSRQALRGQCPRTMSSQRANS